MQIQHNLLDHLNPEQQKAVTAENTNILVLAGAGSGKTRVLVHRIAWLIQTQNVSPHEILAVTFTNKAAHEMQNRVELLIPFPVRNMWIGTFHHIANRLLRQHWKQANLPESFQILDSEDQYRLVRRITHDLNLDEEKYLPKQMQWYINQKKDEGIRTAQITDIRHPFEQNCVKIYQEYEKICQQNGLVDFSELLLRSYELLKNHLDLLQHYQMRFRHILVDEFQDTNNIQYDLLRLLVTDQNNIMMVGDDDQSIYSWRGANVGNIQKFLSDFPTAVTIKLEQNYRSTGNILHAANNLIANNQERLGKNLWTEGHEGERISLYEAFNDLDEARFIVSKIQTFQQTGNNYQECAILYRSNAQSRILEQVLVDRNVPYRIYGGLRFFERAEIKNALAYLHLIANRDNNAAFERIINTPNRGIGYQTLEKIRVEARQKEQSLWATTQEMIQNESLSGRGITALRGFIHLIELMKKYAETNSLDQLVEYTIQETHLIDYHQKEGGETARTRIENLEELVSATKQFMLSNAKNLLSPSLTQDNMTLDPNMQTTSATCQILSEFLSQAALESGENQADANTNAVQLMTLHSAKGLEFPIVFLTGLEENLFPHRMSMEKPQDIEEERRLCYVGMTRAKQKLFLTYAQIRRLHGYESMQYPSRFIREIPENYIEPIRVKMQVRESFISPKSYSWTEESASGSSFKLGDQVAHQKFGTGVILKTEGTGDKAQVLVHFRNVGQKWLALSYANLKKSNNR